jgi:DNA-binding beta-propeller fold protein YncE
MHRRRIQITLVLLAALVVSGPGAQAKPKPCTSKKPAACNAHASKPKPKPKPPPLPAPATLAQKISAGAGVTDIVDAFGSLWVRVSTGAGVGGDTIEQIDPTTNAIVAKIAVVPGFGLGASSDALWAPNDPNTVTRIDPTTNRVVAQISLPNGDPRAVAATPGAVWVGMAGPSEVSGELVRLDPATNAVVDQVPLKNGALSLTAVGSVLWIIDQKLVDRFDTSTGQLTTSPGSIANTVACGRIAADASVVWVTPGTCGIPTVPLEKLDPTTGSVRLQPKVPQPGSVALGFGSLWAVTQARTLLRLDPANGKVTGSMPTDIGPTNVTDVAFGALWVGDSSGVLERFTPK